MSVVPQRFRGPRSWSLATKLLAAVVALYIAVTLVTGGVTALVMNRVMTNQLQAQLTEQAQPLFHPHNDGSLDDTVRNLNQCLVGGGAPGRGEGTAVVCLTNGYGTGYVVRDNSDVSLSNAQVLAVDRAGITSDGKTVDIDGLGRYRFVSNRNSAGTTVVTGLPTRFIDHTLTKMLVLIGCTSLAGLVLVLLLGGWLIRRSLLPLGRVAAVARKVSQRKLDSGEVALTDRLTPTDMGTSAEVSQVGTALNGLLDHVEDALQSRQESEMRVRQFVADASHELRTPLASIRGYAELSRREREPVPASVSHALGRVESEALRMQGLVEDLLLLARLDAGRPLEREPVDLTLMAMNAVSDAHAAAPDHTWRLDLPDEPVEVEGDGARLQQVVVNLLANARVHTPAGSVVTLGLDQHNGTTTIKVHDNGPGVPASLQKNVFQRFTRGDDSRNRASGSTGLGLSIVDAVATAHGGHVDLDSEPGDTTFSVTLPTH